MVLDGVVVVSLDAIPELESSEKADEVLLSSTVEVISLDSEVALVAVSELGSSELENDVLLPTENVVDRRSSLDSVAVVSLEMLDVPELVATDDGSSEDAVSVEASNDELSVADSVDAMLKIELSKDCVDELSTGASVELVIVVSIEVADELWVFVSMDDISVENISED